jgi:hypothetical protein
MLDESFMVSLPRSYRLRTRPRRCKTNKSFHLTCLAVFATYGTQKFYRRCEGHRVVNDFQMTSMRPCEGLKQDYKSHRSERCKLHTRYR